MDRRARLRWGVVAFLALTMTSCSKFRDAIVFNPCSQTATVSFAGIPDSDRWFDESSVPAGQAVRLDNVISASTDTSYARVVFDSRTPTVIKVAVKDDPVPVLIPASLCL
jgi:hypothetical protein